MKWIKKGLIFEPNSGVNEIVSHAAVPFADINLSGAVIIYFNSRNVNGQAQPFRLEVNSSNLSEILSIEKVPYLSLGDLGTFDDNGIMPFCIVDLDEKRFMYYIGWNPQVRVSYKIAIGLAISYDYGKTFYKYSKGPIFDRTVYEPNFVTSPFVIIDNGKWRMWYTSCTEWVIVNNHPEPKYLIKYSESVDGINWKYTGITCIDYDESTEAIVRPCVIKENNLYKMWYSYRKITGYRTNKESSYRLGYAESLDGLSWNRKDNLVGIECSQSGWDSEMIAYCHVLDIEGKRYMFYNGNGFGKSGFGYAVLE